MGTMPFLDALAAGNQNGGVARAAWGFHRGDGMSRDAAGGFDDLFHAEPLPVAQIVDATALIEGFQCEDVRRCQVLHVDVIAPAALK